MSPPYYEDEWVTLHHGDWRELIPADFAADLILTDPPYAETALAARHSRSMWCFGSLRMFVDRAAEFRAWRLSQDVVWEKHNGSSFAADRFRRVHEHAVHWYRGEWSSIHHQPPTTADATPRTIRRKAKPAHHQGARGPSLYTSHDGGPRAARSVIYARSMHGRAINETQKPVPLCEQLIHYGCPSGGVVLDLFAGSCSTLLAARNIGRAGVGYEIREDQCEKAARRLSQAAFTFGDSQWESS